MVRLSRRSALLPTRSETGWCGTIGITDPRAELANWAGGAVWYDEQAAFAGGIAFDRNSALILCGDVLLDNAPDLRMQLELPHATDAELLAELISVHGPAAILHARGMFAVAAWQPNNRRLTLMRDSVGARNLYYAVSGGRAWFGSTLRLVRKSPGASSQLSLTALRNYLTCAYVPGANTMWQNIHEVRPGSAVTLPDCSARLIWRPQEREWADTETLEEAALRLRPLLESAVEVCLSKNEPVGVFLSGGLDSSLVTALAARLSHSPVHTYAIHFGEQHRNELEFSSIVAAHCGTRHRIIELPGRSIAENLAESIARLDDPIGDPLTTPNLILGRAAANDVKTVLNGEGGDPCFGGPKNLPMLLNEIYGDTNRVHAYLRAYQKCFDDLPELLSSEAQNSLKSCEAQEAMFEPYFSPESGMCRYLNQLMLMNTVFKGADHILTKVNNLTTANGLVGRSPLFDRRIVEASFAIRPEHKQSGAVEKAVLKRAVADLLPVAILNRPKSGMLVPVQAWFKGDLKRMARSMLLSRSARIKPYIRQDLVKEWLAYKGNLWPRHGVKLWLLLTLEIWLRENE